MQVYEQSYGGKMTQVLESWHMKQEVWGVGTHRGVVLNIILTEQEAEEVLLANPYVSFHSPFHVLENNKQGRIIFKVFWGFKYYRSSYV